MLGTKIIFLITGIHWQVFSFRQGKYLVLSLQREYEQVIRQVESH